MGSSPLPISPDWQYLFGMEIQTLCVFCSSSNMILEKGGEVIGVIPEFLRTEELAHEGLTEMIVTGSMHERKIEMSRRADAFAVLPGGFGTLDEFFEVLTWKQLGLHAKQSGVPHPG